MTTTKPKKRAARAEAHAAPTPDRNPERIPSIPVYHEVPEGHLTFPVEDDGFAPMILTGDTVIVDPGNSWLDDGEISAVRRDGKARLWTTTSDSAYFCDEDDDVRLLTINDPSRWAGPIKRESVETIGRVVGLLDKSRPVTPEGGDALLLSAELQWLDARRIAARLKEFRLDEGLPAHLQFEQLSASPPARQKELEAERCFHHDKAGLTALLWRQAALGERTSAVKDKIVRAATPSTDAAVAKLCLLWEVGEHVYQDAADPDWCATLLKDSIEALGGEVRFEKWNKEYLRAHFGHLEEAVVSSATDPIIALIQRVREAREAYGVDQNDAEVEAFERDVFTPAEDALLAAKPTTREGVVTLLDFAIWAQARDAEHLYVSLFKMCRCSRPRVTR